MQYRRLGKTNLQVSEVSFGTWQLGNYDHWGGMTDQVAHELVDEALAAGCNLFDTAPNYALTNSERLLGESLRGRRDDVVIVSKFGHRPDTHETDFSVEWFWESLHQSLRRLQTDYLDVFLAHSPPLHVLNGHHGIWQAMDEAKQQGKIRFFGASTDYHHEVDEVLTSTDSQVLELLFNALHQDVRLSFEQVRNNDVGILCKVPLDSGWLSGKYSSNSQFDGVRARWSKEEIRVRATAVETIKKIMPEDWPLAESALAYLLSYPEVSAVIPGIRSSSQLKDNFAAVGKTLDPDTVKEVEHFWESLTNHGEDLLPW